MSNNEVQALRLKSWRPLHGDRGPGDPQFSARKKISKRLLEYLTNCHSSNREAELVFSASYDQNNRSISLHLAIPENETENRNRATLEDYFID